MGLEAVVCRLEAIALRLELSVTSEGEVEGGEDLLANHHHDHPSSSSSCRYLRTWTPALSDHLR